ncbi:MAG: DUF2784 domain-containing protein [Syntrophales bacterium]|nr:DUF2784 domain-containing protein [Syntrophales bacterium]
MNFYLILSNLVILVHFFFILFVILGGLLVIRSPKMAIIHAPAAFWGAYIEYSGGICPLTPLENYLRRLAGVKTYEGDFIVQYLQFIIYPEHLTSEVQFIFGTTVVVINAFFYMLALRRWIKGLKP